MYTRERLPDLVRAVRFTRAYETHTHNAQTHFDRVGGGVRIRHMEANR